MINRYCPQCGSSLARSGNFCFLCGTRLICIELKCACGKDLQSLDKFCPDCGRPTPITVKKENPEVIKKEVTFFGDKT